MASRFHVWCRCQTNIFISYFGGKRALLASNLLKEMQLLNILKLTRESRLKHVNGNDLHFKLLVHFSFRYHSPATYTINASSFFFLSCSYHIHISFSCTSLSYLCKKIQATVPKIVD